MSGVVYGAICFFIVIGIYVYVALRAERCTAPDEPWLDVDPEKFESEIEDDWDN